MTSSLNLILILSFFSLICSNAFAKPSVKPGIETLLAPQNIAYLKGKKIGLITNHTAVDTHQIHTFDKLKEHEKTGGFKVVALFAPEHGFRGADHANENVKPSKKDGIPIYSLHGDVRRPTSKMLKGINLLIYDIQDIGSRSYTYTTTLFYAMEEAAKRGIKVYVLDRPNPLGGQMIDGPMLDSSLRSMVGYINVPYCHGMTVGELAKYFNHTYDVHCDLTVFPMNGWKRDMLFQDTGLTWIPTSPQIPEPTTPLFYPATGLIGELSLVNIGIGYTLPFKCIGAPWIQADILAGKLNAQKFPGVHFEPFCYKPFYGKFAKQKCEGVLIVINDPAKFRPVSTQYLIMGMLKNLYPKEFKEALQKFKEKRDLFEKVSGSKELIKIMESKPYITWPMITHQKEQRKKFFDQRQPFLISAYNN